jgi:hypothetical protein
MLLLNGHKPVAQIRRKHKGKRPQFFRWSRECQQVCKRHGMAAAMSARQVVSLVRSKPKSTAVPIEYHANRYGENNVPNAAVRNTLILPAAGVWLVRVGEVSVFAPVRAPKLEELFLVDPHNPVVWSLRGVENMTDD